MEFSQSTSRAAKTSQMHPQGCQCNDVKSHYGRRSLFKTAMGFILSIASGTGVARAADNTSGITEEEMEPFRKIAAAKGFPIVFRSRDQIQYNAQSEMHLDMDMVRASIQNAIERAKNRKLTAIQIRLERLLSNGTAAQQVDFVLGSGKKYFFPEDVEKWAEAAEKDKFHTFGVVCNSFCWLSCICTQYRQECQEHCRDIFCPEK